MLTGSLASRDSVVMNCVLTHTLKISSMSENAALPVIDYASGHVSWYRRGVYGIRVVDWLRVGIIVTLMMALYWPNLRRLWLKTNLITGEANWSHSLFVPLLGLYYLYLNREAIEKARERQPLSARARALGAWLQLQLALAGTLFLFWAYYQPLFDGRRGMLLLGAGSLLSLALLLPCIPPSPGRAGTLGRARDLLAAPATAHPHGSGSIS